MSANSAFCHTLLSRPYTFMIFVVSEFALVRTISAAAATVGGANDSKNTLVIIFILLYVSFKLKILMLHTINKDGVVC